jgi:uncharacterized protein (DUF2236 family)
MHGMFGPESVTWRVHSDPLMMLGGLRALLLQATHPAAMSAFAEHSAFRDDVWGRLARTAEYVGVTTFGTRMEAMVASAQIRAIHSRVSGTTPEGKPYRADDPELLAWVHCCLVASFLDVVSRGGVALPLRDRDAYIAEQVRSAALVGLEPDQVPHDRAELTRFFRTVRPQLRVTPTARSAALVVLMPPMPTKVALATPARPAWAAMAGLAFATLPGWVRRMYALPDLPGAAALNQAGATLGLRAVRVTLRGVQAMVPPLREGPHLRAARQRLSPAAPTR